PTHSAGKFLLLLRREHRLTTQLFDIEIQQVAIVACRVHRSPPAREGASPHVHSVVLIHTVSQHSALRLSVAALASRLSARARARLRRRGYLGPTSQLRHIRLEHGWAGPVIHELPVPPGFDQASACPLPHVVRDRSLPHRKN